MPKFKGFLLCGALVLSSGCSAIRNELRHPGGYPGALMDRRTFDASRSKQLQLLRATMMIAIAARIGEQSVEIEDADAFARQLAEASREVNFAAADAGFGVRTDGEVIETCAIGRGFYNPQSDGWDERAVYEPDPEDECAGYYVNFESHIARIEGRVIRAMLTSLPTDKARQFLDKLSSGDVLSALWSLTRSFAELAAAFHNAAGVYRAGSETMAASMNRCVGDGSYAGATPDFYDEQWDTVLVAAQCLGLSRADLFDADSAAASDLPVKFPPKAFHALFRIARAACVALPLQNSTELSFVTASRNARAQSCGLVRFEPAMRPLAIDTDDGDGDDDPQVGAVAQAPAAPAGQVPTIAPPPP